MNKVRLLTKNSYHEEESEGSWAISYGDMITLLLSFFVIYFTTDPKKETIERRNTYLALDLESKISEGSKSSAQYIKVDSAKESTLPDIADSQDTRIKVTQVGDQLVVAFGTYSFFNSGSTDITQSGSVLLTQFAQKYLPYAGNYRLSIKAFTDSRPVKSKRVRNFKDNLELSALRSISAMRVLQKAGLPLKLMEIAGAGELATMSRALPNASELSKKELQALSRTVVLVISPETKSWP